MQQLAQNQLDFLRPILVKAMTTMGFPIESRPTLDDVKKRYRELAIKHHPDKGGSESKMKEIVGAYELLIGKTNLKIPAPIMRQQVSWIRVNPYIYSTSATNNCTSATTVGY